MNYALFSPERAESSGKRAFCISGMNPSYLYGMKMPADPQSCKDMTPGPATMHTGQMPEPQQIYSSKRCCFLRSPVYLPGGMHPDHFRYKNSF